MLNVLPNFDALFLEWPLAVCFGRCKHPRETNQMQNSPDQGMTRLINLHQIDGAFSFDEGFSRPDWHLISKVIREKTTESLDRSAGWNEAARQWVRQLRADSGGDYEVAESQRFLLLTALGDETRARILSFAENTLDQIRERLKDAAWNPKRGKHVILLFAEEDDYYQYVSYFHRDGIHPTSGGCLIHKDYVHIAIPYEPHGLRETIAHELTHNCLVHLKLPLWLNEGLAQLFQHAVATRPRPLLDHELREKHLVFWNEQTVQEFWAGVSFRKPGDSNHLSYSLAEIILNLLTENQGDWGGFIKNADWRDAGQTAAFDFLGADLGSVMATFLGEGDWRPSRKEMVALWEAKKKGGNEGNDASGENFLRNYDFTSHASRNPSPRKLSASNVETRTPPGKTISHQ